MAYGQMLTCLNPCDPPSVARLLELRIRSDASVIDIGCGRGATLVWLSEHTEYTLYGVEPDKELYAEARENCPDAVITNTGAEGLAFYSQEFIGHASVNRAFGCDVSADRASDNWTLSSHAFDAALMECVFSLLEEPVSAIPELAQVLRPQGILLLTDLYSRSGKDISFDPDNALLRHVYGRDTLESFFLSGGFALDSFIDRTADMGTMLAQMLMDGSSDCCLDGDTLEILRQAKAGYGIWIWVKK